MKAAGILEGLRGTWIPSRFGHNIENKILQSPSPGSSSPCGWTMNGTASMALPHPLEGWEADLQPGSVQGAGNSPHLGLHHADPLLPQPLHTVKHIHLPRSLPHLQEEVQGDEGACAPDPRAEDTENLWLVLPRPALSQHPGGPSPVPAMHQHGSGRSF